MAATSCTITVISRNISRVIPTVSCCSTSSNSGTFIQTRGFHHSAQSSSTSQLRKQLQLQPTARSLLSWSPSVKWSTSPECNWSSCSSKQKSFFSRVMAAASVAVSNNYSTAVLQPQVDPVDETVDPVQRMLLEEQCIVLNESDQVIGHDTKRNCHKIVNGDVLLHRAFSVFLFNEEGELLLQQRSKTKITFPLLWTNTCCSHPLYTESELEEKNAIGVKRAARRRLYIELGIPEESISLDDFKYLTRIHYKALSNSVWGEHEIDYILFLQKKDVTLNVNRDEIKEIRWVKLDNVKEMVSKENASLTPWFELILNSRLPQWWSNLDNLGKFEDHDKIHRM